MPSRSKQEYEELVKSQKRLSLKGKKKLITYSEADTDDEDSEIGQGNDFCLVALICLPI